MWTDGGVFDMDAYNIEVFNFATMKMLTPEWHQIFLRAIGGRSPQWEKGPNWDDADCSRQRTGWCVSRCTRLYRRGRFRPKSLRSGGRRSLLWRSAWTMVSDVSYIYLPN